ncbi:MAG: hypothetical protein IPJ65_44160 [Archangiaceae bacterium]|nr:hypothetical protein [Archangiaceae bacterium]
MGARKSLLAALTVVFTSAPAFACHRHLFFWHHCQETVVAVAPPIIPIPIPIPAPVYVAQAPVQVYVQGDMPPPPMVVAEPVYVAPPPAPAPVVVARPVAVVPAPVVVVQPQQPKEEEPGYARLAVKWAPGLSAVVDTQAKAFGPASFAQNFGLEFRLSRYFALRGDLELRSGARSWDIPGIKVSLFPSSRVHPFASASLSINQVDGQPANRVSLGFMAAAGLDITVWRWFFLSAEARYNTIPGNCCALPRVTGLVGAGVQFL